MEPFSSLKSSSLAWKWLETRDASNDQPPIIISQFSVKICIQEIGIKVF